MSHLEISLKAIELINENIQGTSQCFSAEVVVTDLVGQTRCIDAGAMAGELAECIKVFLSRNKISHAKFASEMIVVILGRY